MVKVHLACSYEKRILPYLYKPLTPPDELWLMGQGDACATVQCVHQQLASTLLNLVMETSSVTVPDAPVQSAGLGEPSNRIIGKIWSFVPTEGGGVCQSQILIQFFQGCFCCNMAGVPKSQPTKSPKIT